MRKLLVLLLAGLLICGSAMAASNYESENVVIFGPNMGSGGITPPVMIVKCSLGSDDSGSKGDVLVWDVTVSTISDGAGLGYVVRRCDINSASDEQDGDMGQYTSFAGVLVTTTSRDSAWTTADASGPEVGYMAVKGYCDAKTMTHDNEVILGRQLVLKGATTVASFGTVPETVNASYTSISEDIGILLETAVVGGGLSKVWLH